LSVSQHNLTAQPYSTTMLYYLLLGSNLGDRLAIMQQAETLITEQLGGIKERSHYYETAAWGDIAQPPYYNQAICVSSKLAPHDALNRILSIETQLGRTRTSEKKWASRTIDIDILLIDDLIIDSPKLSVPHPQLPNRSFALLPLIEIAGEIVHPVLQLELDDVYEQCTDELEVILVEI
jgi:2-amino-4-hydroxy-6-hydroxymethyldihydropteridine diphosphokinase